MATPLHRNPSPRGHKIYNFGRGFHAHHYFVLRLSEIYPRVQKKIFKEIMHFHYMTIYGHILSQEPPPGGHEIYNFGRGIMYLMIPKIKCDMYMNTYLLSVCKY